MPNLNMAYKDNSEDSFSLLDDDRDDERLVEVDLCSTDDSKSEAKDGKKMYPDLTATNEETNQKMELTEDFEVVKLFDVSTFTNTDSCNESEWEVLSDVQSIQSFNTFAPIGVSDGKMTYKDAFLKSPSHFPDKNDRNKAVGKDNTAASNDKDEVSTLAVLQEEKAYDEREDCFFDRDGVKGMRGGRKKALFKGNSRTCSVHKTPKVNERKRGNRKNVNRF